MENIFEKISAEEIAFKTEEMIACDRCGRKSAPTRLKCLYCGTELELNERRAASIKPFLRKLEFWEKGFNVIYLPGSENLSEKQRNKIGEITQLETSVLQKISELKTPLPLARVESVGEAEIIKQRLRETEVETVILSDETLNTEKPPKRLRGIEFLEDKLRLKLFNSEENMEVFCEDLVLIISGAVFERRVEATEKRNRNGENKLLNAAETASDESLIDLYSRADFFGFRVEQTGFDFSCLGADKKMLAVENIKLLTGKLKRFAANGRFVDDYLKARPILGDVWEIEERRASKGLVREKFGKFNLGSVTTVNNLTQFTKYSRLRRHIL